MALVAGLHDHFVAAIEHNERSIAHGILGVAGLSRAHAIRLHQQAIRFLFVSGETIQEPVAWRGPIVMNTSEELQQAYAELREGTFIK